VSPGLNPDDDELALFWRSVKESAQVYAELMQRLAQGESLGVAQHGKGRLYQVKQRGLRQELAVERMLRDGLLRNLDLGARVRWFLPE
jgi:antitoxin (DNA-binding transcriptional repressor) of toxin-antitoxin stability system